jgi:DNA adenine methylase
MEIKGQRPFLKWLGGKYRVLPHIIERLPTGPILVEPFVGAGAIFLNTHYPRYVLNDINPDLMTIYRLLQQEETAILIKKFKRFFQSRYNTEEQYYTLRTKFNHATDDLERSLLFLYLNRHGYNGLCRYNAKERFFNVPFGRYSKPYFPETEIMTFAHKLKTVDVKLVCQDFRTVLAAVPKGGVVYCDPPYVPLSQTARFTAYGGIDFLNTDQEALAHLSANLARKKNACVVISNHDTPEIKTLYQGAEISYLNVARRLSCQIDRRLAVGEVLAVFKACAQGDQ